MFLLGELREIAMKKMAVFCPIFKQFLYDYYMVMFLKSFSILWQGKIYCLFTFKKITDITNTVYSDALKWALRFTL